ncbi:MAG: hypothetical protein RBR97_17020 [Bacteroidales bacterium]|nr:hypothetical protein [Bacteroidales bacterium]
MKKITGITLLILLSCGVYAQDSISCKTAIDQLQSYAGQVNEKYKNEYLIEIDKKCEKYKNNTRPANYQNEINCKNNWHKQLNEWYWDKSQQANELYKTIVKGCLTNQSEKNDNLFNISRSLTSDISQDVEIKLKFVEEQIIVDKEVIIKIPTTVTVYK